MVILLGGNSYTGKTLMAQRLLEKYEIPYFSIDNLKMGLYRSDSSCGFTPTDSNEAIAEKLWPIIREMIKTVIENNQNIIIEGAYILPRYIKEFEEKYSRQIISVFLGFSSNYIRENFESGIIGYRSIIETRGYPEERPVSRFIDEYNKLRKQCVLYDIEYFEIESDYEEEIKKAYYFIDSKIVELNKQS